MRDKNTVVVKNSRMLNFVLGRRRRRRTTTKCVPTPPNQQQTLNKLPPELRCRNFVSKRRRLSVANRHPSVPKKCVRNSHMFRPSFPFCMPPLVVVGAGHPTNTGIARVTVPVATIVVVSAEGRHLSCNKVSTSLIQRWNASAGVRIVGKKNLIATYH